MLEHRDAFMETLRSGPELRRRIFESLEQRFGDDFGKDRIGRNLYDTLHSAVQDADVPDALAEFEKRFLPLVDGRRLPRQIEIDTAEAGDEIRATPFGRARGWIMAIVAAAVVVGGLIGGLGVLNGVLAKHQAKAKPPASEVQVSEPAPAPAPQRAKPANPIRTIDDQAPAPEGAPTGDARPR
jgi:hypothetical protein